VGPRVVRRASDLPRVEAEDAKASLGVLHPCFRHQLSDVQHLHKALRITELRSR
jgi:hypothetical protein